MSPKVKRAKGNGEDPAPPEAEAKANGEGDADPAPETEAGDDYQPIDAKPGNGADGEVTPEDLDEDAAEFARLRRDLPHVEGAATLGITGIAVVKADSSGRRNTIFVG